MGHELRAVVGSETFLINTVQVVPRTIVGTRIATVGMGAGSSVP